MSIKRRSRLFGLVVAAALIASACSPGDEPATETTTTVATPTTEAPTTTEPFEPQPGLLYVPECDDASDCAAGFVLDDVFYEVDCYPIREDAVTSTELGRGDFAGNFVIVNVIEGVSHDEMVAFSYPGGICKEGDIATSPWSAAYAGSRSERQNKTICLVGFLTGEQKVVNGCSDGPDTPTSGAFQNKP